jgi:polyribonucleotide nucleotidyltransferase
MKLGDVLDVKYFGVDPRTKKPKVSRKALLEKPERPQKNEEDSNKSE